MLVLSKGGQSTPSSSADGRAGSTKRPARPSVEPDQSKLADRRAGPVQFHGGPSWIEHATSLVIRRAGLVQFGGWPSWNDCGVTVPSSLLPPSGLDWTCYCFISIRVTVGTLRFKTAITRCLIWSSNWSYKTATVNLTPGLPPLYEKFEPSSESTSFQKRSFDKS